jgi:hypothetical protein
VRSSYLRKLNLARRAAPQTPLRAFRAIEDKHIVCIEVRLPAVAIVRQPDPLALGALGDEGDLLGTPAGDLGRAQPSHGGEVEASCPG